MLLHVWPSARTTGHHVSVTPFGLLFLSVVGLVLARRRDWLVALLVVSAVLHAPAVAVIGADKDVPGIGITPWLVVAFASFVVSRSILP